LGESSLRGERLRIEAIAVSAVALAILTNGPSVTISRHYAVPLGWERWPYIIPMGLVALAGVFLAGRSIELWQVRLARWPLTVLAVFMAWTITSVMWSVAPDATATRSLLTTGVAMFGIWYGLCLSFREQLLALSISMSTLTLWSLAVILLQPHTHQIYPPPWHPGWHTTVFGIFGNPNSLGPVAALAALTAIGVWWMFPNAVARAWAVVTAVVGVILVLWSQCETAIAGLIIGVIALACMAAMPLLRKARWWVVAGSLLGLVLVAWKVAFATIDRWAPAVGGSAMLSSRRLIWSDVRSAIALRPWRGYGFFAFWDNPDYTAATYQHIGTPYGSAHNSVLEVALGLGRVGVVLFLVLAGMMIVGVARALWKRTTVPTVGWAILVLFLVVQNSMESFVLWHSYLWMLFVAATVIPTRLGWHHPEGEASQPEDVVHDPERVTTRRHPDEALVGLDASF